MSTYSNPKKVYIYQESGGIGTYRGRPIVRAWARNGWINPIITDYIYAVNGTSDENDFEEVLYLVNGENEVRGARSVLVVNSNPELWKRLGLRDQDKS